jgi:hypothetical protein
LYRLINDRIAEITQAFKQTQDLEDYSWLSSALHEEDVSTSAYYQRRFRAFWRMRCGDEYGRAFFAKLEASKRESGVDPILVAGELYAFPTREQNKTLQFSFATKLAHMINSHLPIYDSMISAFYFLPMIGSSGNIDARLRQCRRYFVFLKTEYARILAEGSLNPAICVFRQALPHAASNTDEKVIDWLVWKFVDLAYQGEWFPCGLCHHNGYIDKTK